jgi:hypothetical protein
MRSWLAAASALSFACEDPAVPVTPPPTALTIDTIVNRSPAAYDDFVGLGDEIHVAFQVTADQVEARFTPRFDDTFVFRGDIEGDRLVLLPVFDPEMRAAADYNATVRILWIARLELEAQRVSDDRATFGSHVRFFGRHAATEGDLGGHAMVDGDATLGDDSTPPRARVQRRFVEARNATPRLPVATPGITYPLPPWDPIVLRFSEPVWPSTVIPAIRVSHAGAPVPFHAVEEPFPVIDLELAPDAWWPPASMLTVEIESFEDLEGNTSEPSTLDVIGADHETGEILGEVAVPVEAGCSPTDDCIAFEGGGCDNPGGAIVGTGPAVEVRVIAPDSTDTLARVHVDIDHGDLRGEPTRHAVDARYGSDTGWMMFELPAPVQPVLAVDIRPYPCWGLDRFATPVTVVVRR